MGAFDWLTRRRLRKDAEMADYLSKVRARLRPGECILRVDNADKPFKRGTRAYVTFDDGSRTDAFFWNTRVRSGEMLVVSGGVGSANQRSAEAFYVNQIHRRLPAKIWVRSARHWKRESRVR